jgi:ABC-type multidrug transport system ATPase subunit
MMHELRFENARLSYGAREVVRVDHLHVRGGEGAGLVGPNGAGKTSIARLATGFRLPTSGHVTMDGMPARDYRNSCGIGYVAEELPRPGATSAGALLDLRMKDAVHAAAADRDRIIELTGVRPLLDRSTLELSKGQWRAVLIAYAALSGSGLVVLDEPEAGLDPNALDHLAELVTFIRSQGAVVLILSHQLFEVERTCDRVLFVSGGRVVAEEAAASGGAFLRQRYKEVFA